MNNLSYTHNETHLHPNYYRASRNNSYRCSAAVYRRRRIFVAAVLGTVIFLMVFLGSELLGHLNGTPRSVSARAAATEVSYVVQPGDTLWNIAGRINPEGRDIRKTVDRLLDATGSSVLQPGQRIFFSVG